MFKFVHTDLFYLLAVIPLLAMALVYLVLWRRKAIGRYGDPEVIRVMMPDFSRVKIWFKYVILMMALAALIVAMARPQTGSRIEKVKRKGIDLMICLDVSNSMMAMDIKPNRLERAKQSIIRLIDNLEGDRLGIIIFAGKAYTQLPITTDYAAAKMFTENINTSIVPTQGTAISQAIELSVRSFGGSKHNKAIVIITDGEDHEGSVLEQAELAVKENIRIYTIGMGLPEGSPIPEYRNGVQIGYKKDREGNTVMTRLDETLLQRLASVGSGMYVRATTSETGLGRIFEEIGMIEKADIEEKQFSDYEDQYQYFLALALFLLMLDLFVFERKTRWMKYIQPFRS